MGEQVLEYSLPSKMVTLDLVNALVTLAVLTICNANLVIPQSNSFLHPELARFPRDFKSIPFPAFLGASEQDLAANRELEDRRMNYLESELHSVLKNAVEKRSRPIFSTALIAGDAVILDVLAKLNALKKVPVIFIDTFTLFPETVKHLSELEHYYNFKSEVYHAAGLKDRKEYLAKYGEDFWKKDMEQYDLLSKVEPMNRALSTHNSDCWINGRRRDHGAERSFIPVYESKKLNPLAHWTFEDCWNYLRRHRVPYHPLHDVGYPSLGDQHSTAKVEPSKWFTYGGERSGRFQNLVTKSGGAKTECGIHSEISSNDLKIKTETAEIK